MMDTKFRIFLDLEETVINNWNEGMLINSTAVRQFLVQHQVKSFDVFSFAVWDKKDQESFDKHHRRALERSLDAVAKTVPSVEQMMATDFQVTKVKFDNLSEFIATRGKVTGFLNWCKAHHPKENCLLLDDVVPNIDVVNRDTNVVVRFMNITELQPWLDANLKLAVTNNSLW